MLIESMFFNLGGGPTHTSPIQCTPAKGKEITEDEKKEEITDCLLRSVDQARSCQFIIIFNLFVSLILFFLGSYSLF